MKYVLKYVGNWKVGNWKHWYYLLVSETAIELKIFDSRMELVAHILGRIDPVSSDPWSEFSTSWSIKKAEELTQGLLSVKVLVGDKGIQRIVFSGKLEPKNTCDGKQLHLFVIEGKRELPTWKLTPTKIKALLEEPRIKSKLLLDILRK